MPGSRSCELISVRRLFHSLKLSQVHFEITEFVRCVKLYRLQNLLKANDVLLHTCGEGSIVFCLLVLGVLQIFELKLGGGQKHIRDFDDQSLAEAGSLALSPQSEDVLGSLLQALAQSLNLFCRRFHIHRLI